MACYDTDIFKNQSSWNGLTCPIGGGIFRDPVVDICGHTFCRECITQSLNQQCQCPLSREVLELGDLRPNLAVKVVLSESDVACESLHSECLWSGKLKDLPAHMELCPYFEMMCANPGCGKHIHRMDFESHKATCNHAVVSCDVCQQSVQRYLLENHKENICPLI